MVSQHCFRGGGGGHIFCPRLSELSVRANITSYQISRFIMFPKLDVGFQHSALNSIIRYGVPLSGEYMENRVCALKNMAVFVLALPLM